MRPAQLLLLSTILGSTIYIRSVSLPTLLAAAVELHTTSSEFRALTSANVSALYSIEPYKNLYANQTLPRESCVPLFGSCLRIYYDLHLFLLDHLLRAPQHLVCRDVPDSKGRVTPPEPVA